MKRAVRIVVVDDEPNIGLSLRLILEGLGYQVRVFRNAAELRAFAAREQADAFLVDVRLPDGNGIDLLRLLHQADARTPVIMISGHGTIQDAVEATRLGAFDFLEKPLGRDKVLLTLRNALDQSRLARENDRYKELIDDGPRIICTSQALRETLDHAARAAKSDVRVLLLGESGTGKELLAHHIHVESPFASGPFVKVNCAAIPTELIESELFGHEKGAFTGATGLRRGRFEQADGGSIFLDEVGDLHEAAQAKLLRAVEEGQFQRLGGERVVQVNVRVIAATNRDLAEMVSRKKFREDLYYRLNAFPIRVPPLRERPEDVGPLAVHFLDDFCRRNNLKPKTLEPQAQRLLEGYMWPGNARELRNVVERMAILSGDDTVSENTIPVEMRHPGTQRSNLQDARESAERERIVRALKEANGNVTRAAQALGIERTNLHKRIRSLGIGRHSPDVLS